MAKRSTDSRIVGTGGSGDNGSGDGGSGDSGSGDGGSNGGGDSDEPFTHSVTTDNGAVSLSFTATWDARYVDVHYTLDNGPQQNFRMGQSGQVWTQAVNGATAGQSITYWFTYEKEGPQYESETYTATIPDSGSTGGGEAFSATAKGTSIDFVADVADSSLFVDVHYTVNQGAQLNYRMTRNAGSSWTYTVPTVPANAVVEYWFTYEEGGIAVDTQREQVTAGSGSGSSSGGGNGFTVGAGVEGSEYVYRFTPSWNADFVDVHFINGNGQQENFRMTKEGGVWVHRSADLNPGDFWFTYERDGLAHDTARMQ